MSTKGSPFVEAAQLHKYTWCIQLVCISIHACKPVTSCSGEGSAVEVWQSSPMRQLTYLCTPHPTLVHGHHSQVGDLTHAQLMDLQWRPGGQRVLTVKEAVQITSPHVQCVTLDVKTYQNRY